jgi:hypothetical protein
MDNDKEDGEVSDGDQLAPPLGGPHGQQPEPPRSVPQGEPTAVQKPSNVHGNASVQKVPTPQAHLEKRPADASDSAGSIAQQREDAKQFIRLLHQHNVGYRSLADEGLDAASLRSIYRSLNLPSEPEPVPPPKPNTTASTRASVSESGSSRTNLPSTNGTKPVPSIKTNTAVVPPAKSAPSPVDRQTYVARLQAAKLSNTGAKVTPPQQTPPATVAPVTNTSGSAAAAKAEKEEKEAQQKEVIRQRIEALKKTSSSPAPTVASRFSATQPTHQAPANTSSTSFSGIPGLFMNSQSTIQPLSSGPSRPHDPELAAATIPLDQNDLESEPMVEDVSDGEYEGSEMDLSDDHHAKTTLATPPISTHNIQEPLQPLPLLSNFPSRSASAIPGVSTASTPGPQTPGSQARSEQMDNTGLAMARLKAEIQKKQREKRERELLAAKTLPSLTVAAQGSPVHPTGASESRSVTEASRSSLAQVHVRPPHKDVARESKRRRRAEIESGLPSLDAEIANNAAKMAELTRQMKELAANNEKMKQDKERLIEELESLGIDTEGMPHAELQAKKDEIEREREAISDNGMEFASPATSSGRLENGTNNAAVSSLSAQQPGIPGLGAVSVQQPANAPPPAAVSAAPAYETTPNPATNTTATNGNLSQSLHHPTSFEPAHGNVTEAVGHQRNPTSGDDEEDDFYSPAPPDDLTAVPEREEPIASHLDAPSPSEEGEVAMSESEEEYEPEEPAVLPPPTAPDAGSHNAAAKSSSASSPTSSSDDDEDMYEPPEVDQPVFEMRPTQTPASHNAISQQVEADDGAMDISSSSDESDESESPSPSAADNASPKPIELNKGAEEYITIADDLAPELQVAPAPAATVDASVRI